ncbi:unnamed protein product [Linum trigynum]|uniref:Uncharacterized protein n=1 Tax=Linum trigynum TaxID=586398 RepID=A0AAV2F600_9ROSI
MTQPRQIGVSFPFPRRTLRAKFTEAAQSFVDPFPPLDGESCPVAPPPPSSMAAVVCVSFLSPLPVAESSSQVNNGHRVAFLSPYPFPNSQRLSI